MHTSLTTLGLCFLYACSCGLFVVSTRVGGVPEVLKRHMVQLAEPSKHTTPAARAAISHRAALYLYLLSDANALVQALSSAVRRVQEVDP